MTTKIPLLANTHDSFVQSITTSFGKGSRHASIIYQEFFRTGKISATDPAFNNARELYEAIASCLDLTLLSVKEKRSYGETTKILYSTDDHLEIESVHIPMKTGNTLCVSSQVGCRMGCSFCETGRMGLIRNLTTSEIVAQLFMARFILGLDIRSVVFMGMGEPFDNFDQVISAFRILSDPYGLSIGPKHITVSTSGRVDGIEKLMNAEGPIPNLAVSINAPSDPLRLKLMPITKKYDLQTLYSAMEAFCQKTGKQILIAYVLIGDENDTLDHAQQLADYLTGLDIKINLIPYNPQSNDRYKAPEQEKIDLFMQFLRNKGYYTLLRQTKGKDIMAACGQLGNIQLRKMLRK